SARCTPGRAPHGPACPQRGGPRLHGAGSAPSPPDLFALVRSYEPPFRSDFGGISELLSPRQGTIFHAPCRNSPPPLAPPPPPPAPRSGPPHLTGATLPPRGLSTSAPSSDACAARSASRSRGADVSLLPPPEARHVDGRDRIVDQRQGTVCRDPSPRIALAVRERSPDAEATRRHGCEKQHVPACHLSPSLSGSRRVL